MREMTSSMHDASVRMVDLALVDALPSLNTAALRGGSNEARTGAVLPGLTAALAQVKEQATGAPTEAWGAFVSTPLLSESAVAS